MWCVWLCFCDCVGLVGWVVVLVGVVVCVVFVVDGNCGGGIVVLVYWFVGGVGVYVFVGRGSGYYCVWLLGGALMGIVGVLFNVVCD